MSITLKEIPDIKYTKKYFKSKKSTINILSLCFEFKENLYINENDLYDFLEYIFITKTEFYTYLQEFNINYKICNKSKVIKGFSIKNKDIF